MFEFEVFDFNEKFIFNVYEFLESEFLLVNEWHVLIELAALLEHDQINLYLRDLCRPLGLELFDSVRVIHFDAPHDFELGLIEDNKRGRELSDSQLELASVTHVEGLAVHIEAAD